MHIKIKRVYDPWEKEDGYRILVDRLWPRGIKKEDLKLDEWAKHLAPSTELRKWFNHEPERFEEFSERYHKELKEHQTDTDKIRKIAQKQPVTLLYASHEQKYNQATVLLEYLRSR